MKVKAIEKTAINAIRFLSAEAVQKANSGHPGTPMGLASVAYFLWQNILSIDPNHPKWPNRDRFVLSCGHASSLLYSLLHLAQVKDEKIWGEGSEELAVSMEDLKNFRQLGSRCPGHPESYVTTGVETTTGPLGQGIATSVGMAIAGLWQGRYFNRPGFDLVDFNVYSLAGDGDLMEGISSEAASLAGHLKLSNLCWVYDDNSITIEGKTSLAFSEDVPKRFESYGWQVCCVEDANNLDGLKNAFTLFQETTGRPTLIIVKSHIGYGAPNKQDTASAHGEPLGEDEIKGAKSNLGWPYESAFDIPGEIYSHFRQGVGDRGAKASEEWERKFKSYSEEFPKLAKEFRSMVNGDLPGGWEQELPTFTTDAKGSATRSTSGKVLNAVAKKLPWMVGGSADLAPSTKTSLDFEGARSFSADDYSGRNFHFGIREHAMCAVQNGLALTGLRAYGSGFLIFTDYARPAIRLSALMQLPVIHIYTHDSVALGEDGPTHQPVEHIASLRAIPGLITFRPADANEVSEGWRVIMKLKKNPAVLILSRQNLPTIDRHIYAPASGACQGAYTIADSEKETPDVLLIATGSEVSLCLSAHEVLKKEGIQARVVSMPSWELFEQQSQEYKESVIPSSVTSRVSVELASSFGWERYVGCSGKIIGIDTFGESAPIKALMEHFGFTVERVVEAAREQVG
ncbi:MAG: transketolase [Nitrospinota bacterium]